MVLARRRGIIATEIKPMKHAWRSYLSWQMLGQDVPSLIVLRWTIQSLPSDRFNLKVSPTPAQMRISEEGEVAICWSMQMAPDNTHLPREGEQLSLVRLEKDCTSYHQV